MATPATFPPRATTAARGSATRACVSSTCWGFRAATACLRPACPWLARAPSTAIAARAPPASSRKARPWGSAASRCRRPERRTPGCPTPAARAARNTARYAPPPRTAATASRARAVAAWICPSRSSRTRRGGPYGHPPVVRCRTSEPCRSPAARRSGTTRAGEGHRRAASMVGCQTLMQVDLRATVARCGRKYRA